MIKLCHKCKDSKNVSEFNRQKDTLDGLRTWCKDCVNHYSKNWRRKNQKKAREGVYRWRNANYIQWRNIENERNRKRLKTDPWFKLSRNLRRRIWGVLKGERKSGFAISSLGCTKEAFVWYIESQFDSKMTWDNYGEWEVDHILPLKIFNLGDPIQLNIACHVSNLQPLWKSENRSKN